VADEAEIAERVDTALAGRDGGMAAIFVVSVCVCVSVSVVVRSMVFYSAAIWFNKSSWTADLAA
jgi:hypothetical protein